MASLWVVLCFVAYCLFVQQPCFTMGLASSNVYIVYMGARQHDKSDLLQEFHHNILRDILGSEEAAKKSMLYSYKYGFSGFSAILSPAQAKLVADLPGVTRVLQNKILSLHTTRSWDFLHVKPQILSGALTKSHSGKGTIIGIFDTGIWPESESFTFTEEGIAPVPSRWKGICQEGEQFSRSNCNRKIIGARWYLKGYEAEFGKLNRSAGVEYLSPRDAVGHGTHTASTAAGALVQNASFEGLAKGVARGGAPAAHIAVYKVCWSTGGCSSADLLAAFDDAISDGVDIISVSLGAPPPLPSYVDDTLAVGAFHAVANGIVVVCSGGNSGPYPQTVINTAPWLVTVAASTIDRAFPSEITLGNNQTLVGQGLYTGKGVDKFYPIAFAEDLASKSSDEDTARSCDTGSLNATLAKGKVILCFQSRFQRSAITALNTIMDAGGIGLIFAQYPTKDVTSASTDVPCVLVDFTLGTSVLSYMQTTKEPVIKFKPAKTVLGQQISPEVATFSSRGPSSLSPSVLKPDISAPGVNILAAWSPASFQTLSKDNKYPAASFMIESGTSMSCPHVSGIVALIRSHHRNWTPAMIRSALVTTASVEDAYGQSTVALGAPQKIADAFDYGGGQVNPNRALEPGLVFDTKTSDYVCFLCSMGYNLTAISSMMGKPTQCNEPKNCLRNLNEPSIVIPDLKKQVTVSRVVTNVGPTNSVYIARLEAPLGTYVKMKPPFLVFNSTTKKQTFKVFFSTSLRVQGRYSFGRLIWEDGLHEVRIPLVVKTVIDEFYAQT